MSLLSLSSTDKWVQQREKKDNLDGVKSIFLSRTPYGVLNKIIDVIQQKWADWQPYAEQAAKGASFPNANEFILSLSAPEFGARLQVILDLERKVNDTSVAILLLSLKSASKERSNADMNHSMGFMNDIDKKTMVFVSDLMLIAKPTWRILADGLGFDNEDIKHFSLPSDMLAKWMKSNPSASLYRLYFEAKQLEMNGVCRFLEAIPLEGSSQLTLPPETYEARFLRPMTRFELMRLDELCKETGERPSIWSDLLSSKFPLAFKYNPTLSPLDILWKSSASSRQGFGNLLMGKAFEQALARFDEEIKDGVFENKSSGGVSYEQIKYLNDAIIKAVHPSWRLSIPEPIINDYSQKFFKGRPWTDEDFLLMYWQDPSLGEKLCFNEFCLKTIAILKETPHFYDNIKQNKVVNALKIAFEEIRTFRSYDPVLAAKLEQKERAEKAGNVQKAALPTIEMQNKDDNCVMCLDRKITTAVIPCGHYGYCLECIKQCKHCPNCRVEIVNVVRIYPIN